MTREIRPGRLPTPEELRRAQDHHNLLPGELARIRAASLAWRNGLAALLAGLLGFGLIKGRTDIEGLPSGWSATVGILLLASLIAGAVAALELLRASHGRPRVVALADLPSAVASDHIEALASVRALRAGIGLTFACLALLVAAVGVTWFGPERTDAPSLLISNRDTTACGAVVGLGSGEIAIKGGAGVIKVDLMTANSIQPVTTCTPR